MLKLRGRTKILSKMFGTNHNKIVYLHRQTEHKGNAEERPPTAFDHDSESRTEKKTFKVRLFKLKFLREPIVHNPSL